MTLYEIIYDFILSNFFRTNIAVGTNRLASYTFIVGGLETNMSIWLSHTCTIAIMFGILWFFWLFTKWLFKIGADLFKW